MLLNNFSSNRMLFNKFLQAVFLIMHSTALSLPLQTSPTNGKHKNTFEVDGKNETSAASLNTTHSFKSKRTLLSKYIPQNTEVLNQEIRIKKSKTGAKRGLSVGVKIRVPSTPTYDKELDKLEKVLELAKMNLEGNLEQVLNASDCPKCDEEEILPFIEKRRVKPAYKCDEWDAKYRLCILERNVGDTVTFYLSTGKTMEDKPKVTWKKEFHMRDSKSRTGFVIDPNNTPENIIIGKQGYELRISPITETDIGYNLFSASLSGHLNAQSKLYFMIRIVPTDLGFVYVGETIELNLRSFISFPAESFSFIWYMERFGEHSTLPSNMRTSASGSSIKISELRQEQEGILACSLYTNLNFLATKKRFLMKDLIKNNDVLKSPPDHTLHFKEENPERRKRFPKKKIKHKRDINPEDIEKALMDFTPETATTTTESKNMRSTTHSYDDYNVEMDVGYPEVTEQPPENFQGIIDNALSGESPVHPIDISVENSPVDVEETDIKDQAMNNYQDQSVNGLQKVPSLITDLKTGKGTKFLNQYSSEQISDVVSKMAPPQNNLRNNAELTPIKQPHLPKTTNENDKNYLDVEIQNGKEKYGLPTEDSDIILNIERIRGPRQVTAEEKISKLISSCFSDYECSGAATCVRSNLKQAGYCKCLPGFYGVGIFCREDIWVGKNNYGMEDLHNPEVPYPSSLPIIEEIN